MKPHALMFTGIALTMCFVWLSGCTAPTKSCCGQTRAPRDGTPRELSVLGEDLAPLRAAFNSQSDRWRVFSLVSPTCSECILGAEAVEKEISRSYPTEKVGAIAVWIPMLPSDNEEAARSSATIFPNGRAKQFYDSRQTVGWAYSGKTFQGLIDRAIKSLPPSHPMAEKLADAYERERPQWDLYMLYAPGVRWESASGEPPVPSHWIRHVGRNGDGNSIYWRDTPDAPLREGDLFQAMREMAEQSIGTPAKQASTSPMRIEVLGFEDCPNTQPLRTNVERTVARLGLQTHVSYVDQNNLAADDLRRGWPTPTVLVDGKDLYGTAAPTTPVMTCRVYAGGLPDDEAIAERLLRFSAAGVSNTSETHRPHVGARQIVFRVEGFT